MFKRDSLGSLYYEFGNRRYELLLGKTSNDLSSDILFIFKTPLEEEIEKETFYGKVIGFLYGGFSDLQAIEETIKKYEEEV